MVIYNCDFGRPRCRPSEHNAPLVVDADGMLPGAIAFEGFEPVAGRHGHILQRTGPVELQKFSQGDAVNCRKTPVLFLVEKLLRIAVGEGLDHEGELPGSVRGFGGRGAKWGKAVFC